VSENVKLDQDKLRELILELRSISDSNHELGYRIIGFLGGERNPDEHSARLGYGRLPNDTQNACFYKLPRVTESVDAAIEFVRRVNPQCKFILYSEGHKHNATVSVIDVRPSGVKQRLFFEAVNDTDSNPEVWPANLAIALLIALLESKRNV